MPADRYLLAVNVPTWRTSFIGRHEQIDSLRRLLAGPARLITLVGMGGSGKTRLATELAAQSSEPADARFGDGVVWADLSTAADFADVARTAAHVVGLGLTSGLEPAAALVNALTDRRLVLLLDNCEQVATACRQLVDALIAGCPQLVIVATSRLPLRSVHEHLVPVPPLGLAAGAGERSEAAELFYDRAARSAPGYGHRADDLAAVNALCARLDGLPLAIELAAPWIRTLSALDLLNEIDRSAGLLASDDPSASDRQRSVRAVLDSTWRVMSEACRSAVRGVSVFIGDFSSEAAAVVAQTSPTVLDELSDLSLIRRQPGPAHSSRFGMHDLVRRYAFEMLERQGPAEADDVHLRHLAYFLDLFERARSGEGTTNEQGRMHGVRTNLADGNAALHWALAHDRSEYALRMTVALSEVWGATSAAGRYRVEVEEALALPWDPTSVAQSQARAAVLNTAGWVRASLRQWEPARRYFEQATALYHGLGDEVLYALGLCDIGMAVSRGPNPTFAPGYARQALAICHRLANPFGIAWATYGLGDIRFAVGAHTQAERLLLDALGQLTRLDDAYGVYCAEVSLAHLHRREGRWAATIEAYQRALRAQQSFGYGTHGADILAGLGAAALALDRPDCAARLFGASRTWGEAHGNMSALNPGDDLDRPRAEAEGRVSRDVEWAWHHAAGRRLGTDQAMSMALADADELLIGCQAPSTVELTKRELQVIGLAAEGLGDAAIARTLVLSPRTVQGHLRSVFGKLGVKTRTAAVRRATELGIRASSSGDGNDEIRDSAGGGPRLL